MHWLSILFVKLASYRNFACQHIIENTVQFAMACSDPQVLVVPLKHLISAQMSKW